jgi:predicted nucleic acid-binding protein
MILADTSVWIDFFRRGSTRFAKCLTRGQIVTHSVVVGELATGNLLKRSETLGWLAMLPRASEGSVKECLLYLESHRLYGRGVGWNDIQLLVSAQLSHVPLWSLDSRLAQLSTELRLAYRAR